MDEKNILDRIRKSADSVEAPDALQPEQVRKKLEFAKPCKKRIPRFGRMAAAAAVVAIVLVSVWQADRLGLLSPQGEPQISTGADSSAKPKETAAPSEKPEGTSSREESAPQNTPDLSQYEQLYLTLKEHFQVTADTGAMVEDSMEEEAVDVLSDGTISVEQTAKNEAAALEGQDSAGGFSQTNIQEFGVDEADTVRTDGTYLYLLSPSGQLRIVKANGAQMELTCTLKLPNLSETAEEMYLDGDTLSLITSGSSSNLHESADLEDTYYLENETYICLYTYDISDRSSPKLTGSVKQEGSYRTSRKQGDYIYLFSEYLPEIGATMQESEFIPKSGGAFIPLEDILVPEELNDSSYLVVSSVDAKTPDQVTDRKAIVSAASLFYVSTENIYICNTSWSGEKEYTQLMKLHYADGNIDTAGAGQVPGSVNDSFSLSEYQGNLRILTTDWSGSASVNQLFVLDKDLSVIGSLQDLAPNETIRSARYLEDTAYFVTFRETDPLFSVDLSDPQNPVLLGSLKVTGFSSYLHFYGENLLLGLGNEVDPDTGEYLGIKLSMFDISDPSNVTEVHKYVLEDATDCPGLYNYKEILADPAKNILGFACDGTYLVFSYDPEKGFINQLTETFTEAETCYQPARGLYISDTFYLADASSVKAYQITEGYSKVGTLDF